MKQIINFDAHIIMKKYISVKWIGLTTFAIAAVAVMLFAVLPQLGNITTHSDLSLTAPVASACCSGGGGGGDGPPTPPPPPSPPPAPTCKITASPTTVNSGGSTNICWSSTSATNIYINKFGTVGASGCRSAKPTSNPTYYLMAVGGPGGEAKCGVQVNIKTPPPPPPPPPPAPTCTLSASASTITLGGSSKLTWTSTNADSATLTNYGGVSTNGNKTVSPSQTTTYTFTAKGSGGTVTCTKKIRITTVPSAPSCTLTADPHAIVTGGSSTLTWTTSNASSVTIDQGIGSVNQNGNTSVSPTSDTTYTLTAVGSGGQVSCHDTVTVSKQPPQTVTVVAHKIVCTDESDLPNWGTGGPDITANTAEDWVNSHASCHFVSGWDFQWGPQNISNPGDTLVGPAGGDWTTFGPTDANGEATTVLTSGDVSGNNNLWLREVLKDNYIPFSYGPNGQKNTDDYSAEFYCHTDVNNYDNYDRIDNPAVGNTYYCVAWNVAKQSNPAPTCTLSADPHAIQTGATSTLTWTTTNADTVSIDHGVGSVSQNGNTTVGPTATTTYTLTAVGSGGQVTCHDTVTVSNQPPAPRCTLNADPSTIDKGDSSTLTWTTENANTISIDTGIGSVSANASTTVSPTSNTTYTLTAVGNGGTVSCPATVTVRTSGSNLSCDSFKSNKSLVNKDESFTLSWNTTGANSVSINQGIGSVSVDGSKSTSINDDTKFTLTATDGTDTVTCHTTVNVRTGGGGGGPLSPRCKLTASDTHISSGQDVELTWNNTLATDLTLEDDRGNILVDTTDTSKYSLSHDSYTVNPTKDTKYKLTVYRSTTKQICYESVTLGGGGGGGNNVTLTSTRSQQPLVAGISLTRVPYTGFDAGPALTTFFYILLVAWSLGVAYVLVIRKQPVLGFGLSENAGAKMKHALSFAAPIYAAIGASKLTPATAAYEETPTESTGMTEGHYPHAVSQEAPYNLPTNDGATDAVGYATFNATGLTEVSETVDGEDEMTELENHAHASNCLLSSDAIRFLLERTAARTERLAVLTDLVREAKASYPSEDGWVVINKERIMALLGSAANAAVAQSASVAEMPAKTEPVGASSLAEAVVTGNIVSAYYMLGENPLLALTDAAQDLDALYRQRKGESVVVSDMLARATAHIDNESLRHAIEALTTAIDGTYSDEMAAVKLAIMKAVRILNA